MAYQRSDLRVPAKTKTITTDSGKVCNIFKGSKMSTIISVRYEPKQDLDFVTGLLGLAMSETVRSLIGEGRKMKALQLYRHGKVSLGLGAKAAKLTLSEFLDLLKEHNVKLNIDVEDAKEALAYSKENL